MMKRLILFFASTIMVASLFSQNYPIAVDDTVYAHLFDSVTVNLVKNDYHPEGVPFKIYHEQGMGFTDSTYSVYLSYDEYWNRTSADTIKVAYFLIDENGNSDVQGDSKGILNIIIENNYFDFLDLNNVKARVQPLGFQFWRDSPITIIPPQYANDGYLFPKDSKKSPVFSSSIWIGGKDVNDSLCFAGERYRQQGADFWAGPIGVVNDILSVSNSTVTKWNRVWKLSKEEIIYHKDHYGDAGYQPTEAIETWPAMGDESLGQAKYLAPFVDVDGDGIYQPMNGDYPLIRGDQCIFYILNDVRNHTETKGSELGIELHVMAYEFNNPDTLAMQNTVFYSYKIFNRSSHTYHNTLFGLYTDFDIGYAWDDYLGCDVKRGLSYAYNDSTDGNGEPEAYGDIVPAQTALILSGPLLDSNNQDNPSGECNESINGIGFGDGIADNERFGMTRFNYFTNSSGTPLSDPAVAPKYYDNMNGLWKDGTAIEYGGNGHISGGAYGPAARFVFPGTSDNCNWGTGGEEPFGPKDWTMKSAGIEPSDVRGTGISGMFTFKPGDMQRFDVAYVSAFAEEGKTALETVLDYSDFVKAKYMENPDEFGYQYLGVADKAEDSKFTNLKVWPNPASNRILFAYEGTESSAIYTVRSVTGKVLATAQINRNETVSVDISKYPKGLYIVNINTQKRTYSAKVVKQ